MRRRCARYLQLFWPSLCLTLVVCAAIAGSLAPFEVRDGSWGTFIAALRDGIPLEEGEPNLAALGERLLTFLPIGLLLHRQMKRLGRFRASATAFHAALAIALMIELSQGAVESRHPRLSDLFLAATASGLGIWCSIVAYRCGWSRGRMLAAAAVAGNLAAIAVLVIPQTGLRIAGWDCAYPLVLANEATGNRSWRGSAKDIALYSSRLSPEDVRRLAMGQPIDLQPDLIVPPFIATGEGVRLGTRAQPGAEGAVDGGRSGAVEPACRRILHSGVFAMAMRVRSADPAQSGPARIVTMSVSPTLRNFTVAEEFGDIVFRIRTPRNGPNGTLIEARTGRHPLDREWHHLVASYENGVGRLFVDGKEATPARRYFRLVVPTPALPLPAVGVAAVLLFALGGSAALVRRSRHRFGSSVLVAVWGAASATAVVAGDAYFGRDGGLQDPAIVLLAPLFGYGMVRSVVAVPRLAAWLRDDSKAVKAPGRT